MTATHTLFAIAERQRANGQVDAAIRTLTRILSQDAEDADAHSLLALCLLQRKRTHAAGIESAIGLSLAPDSVFPLAAAAAVDVARRRFREAEQKLQDAAALDPESDLVQDQLARLYLAWDRLPAALAANRSARALAPGDATHIALAGLISLRGGDHANAASAARSALERDPENIEALCVLGHCELADGNVADARAHASWALQLDPTNEDALVLFAAIKARQSLLLGLWWRFQSFVAAGPRTRAIALLIAMFVLYRAGAIALDDGDHARWILPLNLAWLGFCAYTWFAPTLFWKSVRSELEQVELRQGY